MSTNSQATLRSVMERLSHAHQLTRMNFDEALVAHAEWKLKLHLQLQGEGNLDAAVVSRDDQCKLGRWIYSDGLKYANDPQYTELHLQHARFHRCAGEIVATAQAGAAAQARTLLAPGSAYDQASSTVIDAIAAMKQRVEDKTNLIMGNVSVGILVIDRSLLVQSGYSAHCHDLFGSRRIAGRHVCELLNLTGSQFEHTEACLVQAFEDVLPPEVSLDMLPARVQVRARTIGIRASAIRSTGAEPDYLLFTLEDVTQVLALEQERAESLAMLRAGRNRHAFTRFLRDARERLAALAQHAADQTEIRREIHTIKGNASLFELKDIAALSGNLEAQSSIDHADVERLRAALQELAARYSAALGIALDDASASHSIPEMLLREYEQRCDAATSDHTRATLLRDLLRRLRMRPVRALLGPVEERVAILASKLDKRVQCQVVGDALLVDEERVAHVIQTLAHALRNAVDHGIEPSDRRVAHGKPASGLLELRFARQGQDTLEITLADDGRGIDVQALVDKAAGLGLVTREALASLSPKQLVELMFVDGLSTAATQTEISGRGVGLGALRESVLRAQGELLVDSRPGEGTVFQLQIPQATCGELA